MDVRTQASVADPQDRAGDAADREAIDVFEPGLRRSIALFQAFRVEQTDPNLFYTRLAQDSVAHVAD